MSEPPDSDRIVHREPEILPAPRVDTFSLSTGGMGHEGKLAASIARAEEMLGHSLTPEPPCQHPEFYAQVQVARLTAVRRPDGPVTGYTAEVTVHCAVCQLPFRWVGLPGGSSYQYPTVSADALRLRAPLVPSPVDHPDIQPHMEQSHDQS